MTHISDDILNKYIDNELEGEELSELNEHLKYCSSCLAKLKAQRVVEQQLRRIDTFQLRSDFTQILMKKIGNIPFHYEPKKSYFFRFIVGLFVVLIAVILAAAISAVPAASHTAGPASAPGWYTTFTEGILRQFTNLLSNYGSLFSGKDVSIVGSGLAFIILVSIYIVYESFRQAKSRVH